jgi:hypothetical protein
MMPNRSKPSPEQLAAYVDGELASADRHQVEAWLAEHPEAEAEVVADRHLLQVWRDSQPPDPAPEAWARTLQRIAAAVPPGGPAPRNGRRWTVRFVAGLLTAAAVLGGWLLARPYFLRHTPPTPEERSGKDVVKNLPKAPAEDEGDGPFPVVAPGEVNIISMEAGDADAVVTGHPIMGEFEFAQPTDIEVLDVQPHEADGARARLEQGSVPMIVFSNGDNRAP